MNNRPRHLHDLTAEMPAIRQAPKHAAPGTGEQPLHLPTTGIPRITADRLQYPPVPQEWHEHTEPARPWWKRAWTWLMGA